MKKQIVTVACLCMVILATATLLGGCGEKNKSVLGTVAGVQAGGGSGTEVSLSDTACREFAQMVDGFTLSIREDDAQKRYEAGRFFRVEDTKGGKTNVQFFDRILSINDDRYYDITEQDYEALQAFCDKYEVGEVPRLVLSGKAYLEAIDYDNVIDYSYYTFTDIEHPKQLRQIGAEKSVDSKNMDKYCLVSLGDTAGKSPVESGQLYLVQEKKTGKVVWHEPVPDYA